MKYLSLIFIFMLFTLFSNAVVVALPQYFPRRTLRCPEGYRRDIHGNCRMVFSPQRMSVADLSDENDYVSRFLFIINIIIYFILPFKFLFVII